jgi:ATP-binding cassette, subfamily B (MDR/TAP), member 1
VVMKGGSVVASGTFEELSDDGLFGELVALQERTGSDDSKVQNKEGSKSVAKVSSAIENVSGSRKATEIDYANVNVPWKRLLKMTVTGPHGWYLAMGWIGSLLDGLQFPLQGYIFSMVMASYSLHPDQQYFESLKWSLCLVGLGFYVYMCLLAVNIGLGFASAGIVHDTRLLLFQSILRQDVEFFEDERYSSSALETRLLEDVKCFESIPGSYIANVLKSVVNIVVGLGIAFYTGWTLTVVMLLFIPVILATRFISTRLTSLYVLIQFLIPSS